MKQNVKNLYKTVIFINEINFNIIENKIYFVYYSYLIESDKNFSEILL